MTLATGEVNSGGFVRDADGRLVIATDSATPLSVETSAGTYAYSAGTATGTVDVPTAAKLREVTVVAATGATATVTIGGGNTITIPAGTAFSATQFGGTANLDVVIGGSIQSYYVAWTA